MIDPKKIVAWCAVPAAIIAMAATVFGVVDARTEATAQEAARMEAKAEVDKRMAPVEQQLETLVEQGEQRQLADRRREDREESAWCLDREHQDLEEEVRERLCKAESDARWEAWALEDLQEDPDG